MNNYAFAPTEKMLTPATLAEMLGVSERHLTDIRREDPTFPLPVMLGNLPRWSPAAIRRWMDRPTAPDCSCVPGKPTTPLAAKQDAKRPKKAKGGQRVH